MSNPFDLAIFALKRERGKAAIDDPCPICSYDAAILVLQAAGAVDKEDKELAIHWMEDDYSTIRALLAALPDEVKK